MNNIRIYTMDRCPYCETLKEMLSEANFEFLELNVFDNEKEFEKIVKLSGEDSVPTVIVGKNILAPNKSFNTMKEAFEIINNLR